MIIAIHSPHDIAPQNISYALNKAMDSTTDYVARRIKAKTPVWKGGLRESVHRFFSTAFGWAGFEADNIVAQVFETPHTWSKLPPHEPILAWVKGKLGVSDEKQANSIAWAIRFNIRRFGIQLPLKFSGRGKMISGVKAEIGAGQLSAVWRGYFKSALRGWYKFASSPKNVAENLAQVISTRGGI